MTAWLAAYKVLSEHLEFPFDHEDIKTLLEITLDQHEKMTNSDQVSEFWQIFDYLVGNLVITRELYRLSFDKEQKEILSIRLKDIYPKYIEQAKKQNANPLDYTTLESYLTQHPSFIRQQGREKTTNVRFFESISRWEREVWRREEGPSV
ncbi:MAG: hypothetical protein IPN74_20220 [Haliscomenobacter sp.]|nr:hypothetical protein [Haliscomenobacter sp.]